MLTQRVRYGRDRDTRLVSGHQPDDEGVYRVGLATLDSTCDCRGAILGVSSGIKYVDVLALGDKGDVLRIVREIGKGKAR